MRAEVYQLKTVEVDAGKRDITDFYFLEAARWRMCEASLRGVEAIQEQRQLIREDLASWLDEFAFNMPTRFGYAIGYLEGVLKVVRRHPVHDVGIDLGRLLRTREDMRVSYGRAKDYVSKQMRYRELINESVFRYLVEERFLETAENELIVWVSPPPRASVVARQSGYGSSTHTSLFRVAQVGEMWVVEAVTAISELPLWQTARFGRRISTSEDKNAARLRRLWHPFLRDRDLLSLPFGVNMGQFQQSQDMVKLAHEFVRRMLEENKFGPMRAMTQERQEALLYEQDLAMTVVPQVHALMSGKYERFIEGVASGRSDAELKEMLREIWQDGVKCYVELMLRAEMSRGRDGGRLEKWLGSAVKTREEGRGCPLMSVRIESQVIRLHYDGDRGVYIDESGREYRNVKVVCKHCGKRQSIIGYDKDKGGFFLKKVCEVCRKGPCDD